MSQNSRVGSASKDSSKSALSRRSGAHSRCLSSMSQTSKKTVKSINASLERVHTFGMSSVHKSLHDLEKIDSQYDPILSQKKDKKIVKTTSLAKLKSAITQKLSGEEEDSIRDKQG